MSSIIEITDFFSPELDPYARLTEAQLLNLRCPEKGMFIAESPKVAQRALYAGYEPVSLLMEKKHVAGEGKEIIERCGNIPVFTAEPEVLAQLTGFKLTRGLLCLMRRKPLPVIDNICAGVRRLAVLEDVVNPTNVGAIFRSAAALNFDGVILTSGCSDPLYRRAVRVSMGTVFQIPWTMAGGSTEELADFLHASGFKTAALALEEDSVSIRDERLCAEEKLAVFLGTEGDGLAKSTVTKCDYTVKIPMSHGVDSLNVAAAAAVAFWQLGN